jgi:sigma-B regulation protein RsbU (phosphoserine phosphatase)
MAVLGDGYFREQLLDRRERLQAASAVVAAPRLSSLLSEVDEALASLDRGDFGICTVCHEPVEADRLLHDPLVRRCLDHLTADEQRDLLRDLDLARDVQRSLLPRADPGVEGWDVHYRYLAARRVSGDYCDFIPRAERDETLVLLGDVAGKGVAASILMGSLHAIFRSLAQLPLSTAELLARANRLFAESTPGASYATLLCLVIGSDGRTELYNAGHLPPLLLTPGASDSVPIDTPAGLPLGLFSDVTYEPAVQRIAPGDALVLFTDGITEARNGDEDEYGDARLRAALGSASRPWCAQSLVERTLDDVRQFAGDAATAHDDATVLVARRL